MYLDLLFTVAYFFIFLTVLFLILFVKWKLIGRYWQIAKIKGQNKKEKLDWIKKQEAKGRKPFHFEKGRITIYANSGNQAVRDYKRMKNEQKSK